MAIVDSLNDAVRCLKRQFEKGKEKGKIAPDVPLRVRLDVLEDRDTDPFSVSLVDGAGKMLPGTRPEEGVFVITGTGPANDYETRIFYSPDGEGILVAEKRVYPVDEAIEMLTALYERLGYADKDIPFQHKVEVEKTSDGERYRVYLLGPERKWFPKMLVDEKPATG